MANGILDFMGIFRDFYWKRVRDFRINFPLDNNDWLSFICFFFFIFYIFRVKNMPKGTYELKCYREVVSLTLKIFDAKVHLPVTSSKYSSPLQPTTKNKTNVMAGCIHLPRDKS